IFVFIKRSMVFSSITFLIYFLPITLLLVFGVRIFGNKDNYSLQNFVLLIMSLLFYSWGEPVYVLLMIGSILLNYLLGKAIGGSTNPEKRKAFLVLSIVMNISTLALFKYAGMLAELLNSLIPYSTNLLPVPEIRLPIGISFFTFQAMSYLFDVYKNEVPVQKKVLNLALYISFFPQLIAGPIVRYHDISEQLENRTIDMPGVYYGLKRFIIGLAKKVLIANVMAEAADEIFAMGATELTAPLAWLGIICYTLQIYFDFSGYSDMAIGLGRVFGFKFLENFNFPYIAKNIQDFWRRWHISLSSWFRDYLYIPLGGNRKGKVRTYFNLIIVFFLCGLWHGASWTFVAWGLYHGLFLILERFFHGKTTIKIPIIFNYVYTILVVMVGWVLFRADNFSSSLMYLKAMTGFGANENLVIWKYLENRKLIAMLFIGIIASTPIFNRLIQWIRDKSFPPISISYKWAKSLQYTIIALFILLIVGFVSYPYNNKMANTSANIFEIKSNANSYQLFYTWDNSKFKEENSIKFNTPQVEIPDISKMHAIRIDAILKNGDVWEIESIKLSKPDARLFLKGKGLFKAIGLRSKHLNQPVLNAANNVEMDVLGRDPHFLLAFDYPLAQFNTVNAIRNVTGNDYRISQWRKSFVIIGAIIFILLGFLLRNLWLKSSGERIPVPLFNLLFNGIYVCAIVIVLVYVVASLAVNTYNPFIYFRF
ncbi:MAG TPA: MBOAT family protein, partial [Prolixibacteraceae bacterium]|nr:MBOAT family protein [Prolixibacteraceae bacterium]